MKRLIILSFCLSMLTTAGYAQEYKNQLKAGQKVKILLNRSEMKIEGYEGNEIKITAMYYEQPPERAKGLKPLYNSAQDNTNIGLSITEEGESTIIQEATGQGGEYIIRLPQNARLSVEQITWNGQEIEVRNMKSEIEVQAKSADIHLMNVQGPVIVNNTSGDIEIVYAALSQQGPHMISAVSSEIDISLPAASKANFVLQSVSGEIYTDMDIKLKKKNQNGSDMHMVGGGQNLGGTINGGGTELGIKAISGNIYIRKVQ